jgi:hypothetical protein
MTNQELIIKINALESLLNAQLPVKATYALRKNRERLLKEYFDYEAVLKDLEKRYPDKKSTEYGKEVRELLNIEIKPLDFYKIPEQVILEADLNLSLVQLTALDFMLDTEVTDG